MADQVRLFLKDPSEGIVSTDGAVRGDAGKKRIDDVFLRPTRGSAFVAGGGDWEYVFHVDGGGTFSIGIEGGAPTGSSKFNTDTDGSQGLSFFFTVLT